MPIRHEGSDSRLLISADGVFSASEGREGRRSGTPRPERKKRLHVGRRGSGRSSAAQRNRLEISKNEGKKLAVGIRLRHRDPDLAGGGGSGLEQAQVYLDRFDCSCNRKMHRSLAFELATAAFISRHEDALFLGRPGTGRSHLAQASGWPPSNKDIGFFIGKPTSCWTTTPKPPSMAHGSSSWKVSQPCRC